MIDRDNILFFYANIFLTKKSKITAYQSKSYFYKTQNKFLIEDFHFGHLFFVQFQNLQPILFSTFYTFQRKTI